MAKILLVEDDLSVAASICDVLELEGHQVETVADGKKASDILQSASYAVIILDLDLPLKSGLDVCREFRQSGGNTPVLPTALSDWTQVLMTICPSHLICVS